MKQPIITLHILVFIMLFLQCNSIAQAVAIDGVIESSSFKDLGTAVSSPLTAAKTILISKLCEVNNLHIPKDRAIKIVNGGVIKVNTGFELKISGDFEAGLFKVFDGEGAVKFDNGSIKEAYPQWWGAYADSTHPNETTKAIQSAVNSYGNVYIPKGTYVITSAIQLKSGSKIRGGGQKVNTQITTVECSGFITSQGDSGIELSGFLLNHYKRHTTEANNYIGIDIKGNKSNYTYYNIIRDVFIDGYKVGVNLNNVWSSVFDNLQTIYCGTGLKHTGLGANNSINNSSFQSNGKPGSVGIYFHNENDDFNEGWYISNTLIMGNEIGILSENTRNVYLTNSILDFNTLVGIYLKHSQNAKFEFSSGWAISNNYIAMSGKKALAGIIQEQHNNNIQIYGNRIYGNQIISYKDVNCKYGIYLTGKYSKNNIISNNSIYNFIEYDIADQSNSNTNIISSNQCLSNITFNIFATSNVTGNRGTILSK